MKRIAWMLALAALVPLAALRTRGEAPSTRGPRAVPAARTTDPSLAAAQQTLTASVAAPIAAAPNVGETIDRWLALDAHDREAARPAVFDGVSDEALSAALRARFASLVDDAARDALLSLLCTVSGPSSVPFFRDLALGRGSAVVRHWGVIGLNAHGTDEAIDAMWRVAQTDPDPGVRFIAMEGLGSHIAARERVLPLLLQALSSDEAVLRRGAVYGLAFLRDARAVGPLARLVESDPALAAEAVAFLGEYAGEEAAMRLAAIARASRDAGVREAAWGALLSRGDAAAEEEYLRRAAAGDTSALERLADRGVVRAESLLLEATGGPAGRDIVEAWSARAAQGDASARALLDRAMASAPSNEARVRAAAAIVEAGQDDPAAVGTLSHAAAQGDSVALVALFWGNRAEGIDACAAAGTPLGLDLLEAHALYGGDRARCEEALRRIPGAEGRLARVRAARPDATVERWLAGGPVAFDLADRARRGELTDPVVRVFFAAAP